MKFFETLHNNLKTKGLSESSIKLYLRNLEKLNGGFEFTNFKFLENPEDIMKKIEPYKPNTQRGYLISIVSCLNSFGTKYKKLADVYYKLMLDVDKKLKEVPTNVMSEVQKENWCEWNDVVEKYNQLGNELVLKGKISIEMYNKLLEYLVLSLYVLLPPRRNQDYMKMFVSFDGNTSDTSKNYVDLKNREFIFNVYKTAKTYSQTKIDIPPKLYKLIVVYLKYHPLFNKKNPSEIPFLVYSNGKPLDKINSITRILNKIFGKSIGSSLLRHIYLSSKYGDVEKEMEKDSKLMAHSQQMQKEYIKEL